MATIFISHSKKDEDLVLVMEKTLKNMGHTPIIEEFVPAEERKSVPHKEIRSNVEKSEFLFLFLTDNVMATEYTRSWVIWESGLASADSKKLFVFERIGTPIKLPIPYLTDYALFDPDNTGDILALQHITKDLGKFRRDILTAVGGAVVGSAFGPVGMALGAILGYTAGPKQPKPPVVKCSYCNVSFNYYSSRHRAFSCPSCRRSINLR
ncbi:MAG: toll/interleukin-1 receptor domain-containing protein [Nitrosopumilaceae archaeon]|nr:toll/interleukin-1 receptor domain-containing protein [Nitrosopumilaceae archaeon]